MNDKQENTFMLLVNLNQAQVDLIAKHSKIRTAAQAVINRWHSPDWKDQVHTGVLIRALEDAIK